MQLLNFTQADFDSARRARNHVASHIQREGLTPDGDHMPAVLQDDNWDDIKDRLHSARVALWRVLCTRKI